MNFYPKKKNKLIHEYKLSTVLALTVAIVILWLLNEKEEKWVRRRRRRRQKNAEKRDFKIYSF
jgi:hypothetical protein